MRLESDHRHPLPRLTIAGGFGKISKLGVGHLDLHSGRSQVDLNWLAERLSELGAGPELAAKVRAANTAGQVLDLARNADLPIADSVAEHARRTALEVLDGETEIEVLIFDRHGRLAGRADA